MEKEGLKRSLALLEEQGVTMDRIVMDRHPQIQMFLREANIRHYYNVWHMEKGIILCLIFPHKRAKKCFIITVVIVTLT